MKLAPVLTFLLLAACGPAGANNKVVGTYELDTKAMLASIPKDKMEGPGAAEAAKMVESMKATMEISADGTAEFKANMFGKQDDKKGTWKLDGDKITITPKDATKDQPLTGKVENGTITLSAPGGQGSMIFRKK